MLSYPEPTNIADLVVARDRMEAQCRAEPRSTPIGGDPCPRPPECSSGSNARTTEGRTLPVLKYHIALEARTRFSSTKPNQARPVSKASTSVAVRID
ncbi:hypothetical protein MCOR02_000217 [Pyricularia oryzae]|nr:hypothetical protein MCOR02_000217 [Pyricularia oryzae]